MVQPAASAPGADPGYNQRLIITSDSDSTPAGALGSSGDAAARAALPSACGCAGPWRGDASANSSSSKINSSSSGSKRGRRLMVAGSVAAVLAVAALCGVLAWALPLTARANSGKPAAVAAVPLGAGGVVGGSAPRAAGGFVDKEYCAGLAQAGARRACGDYLAAEGFERFRYAVEWERKDGASYECAGLTPACVNADTMANKPGASACAPRTTGKCAIVTGTVYQLAAAAAAGPNNNNNNNGGNNNNNNAKNGNNNQNNNNQNNNNNNNNQKRGFYKTVESWMTDDDKFLLNLERAPPAPASPQKDWKWFTATLKPWERQARVPATFLATSHEWDRLPDYTDNIDAFKAIFREFGPSPILRIGGASQDFLEEPPPARIWDAMAKMTRAFNASWIIGLPLWRKDSVDDAKAMIKIAQSKLPASSIIGYELGNEPEFWLSGVGGYDSSGKFTSGWDAYNKYFHATAPNINPCSDKKPILSGPGWGNVNTIDAKWLAEHAKFKDAKCYLRELSVHYYPYVNNVTVDAKGLLEQGLQDFGLEKFRWLRDVARDAGLKLRISETNSLYGGGRPGLSDTMAGAMWCADALFAFANAGAEGFHFHWGFGGQPLKGGQPNTGVQTNFFNITTKVPSGEVGGPYPSVHAPWYAYLLFREATAGADGGFSDTWLAKTDVSAGECRANMKVWTLIADDGELRAAVLNKDADTPCNVVLNLDAKWCGGPAEVKRLMPGALGMQSKAGITWRGQTYDQTENGYRRGDVAWEKAYPAAGKSGGGCTVGIAMPPASGAVVELKKK